MKFSFPYLTSFEDAQRNFEQIEAAGLFVGSGAPTFPAQQGNYYLRTDTPSTSGQQMYVNTAQGANWQPLLFAQNPARAYRSTAFTLTAGAWTKVPVDAVTDNPGGNFDVTTNHRYNVPAAGRYQINATVAFFSTLAVGQSMYTAAYQNGAPVGEFSNAYAQGTGQAVYLSVSSIALCAAGDYLELWAFCSQAQPLQPFYSIISVARTA